MEQLLTFESVAEQWLAEKKKLVKHSTYCAYLLAIKTHLLPEFASKSEVSEEDARQFVYAKLASGLGRKTVHDILAILRAIMKFLTRVRDKKYLKKLNRQLEKGCRFIW